jgi:hypothetical protein
MLRMCEYADVQMYEFAIGVCRFTDPQVNS